MVKPIGMKPSRDEPRNPSPPALLILAEAICVPRLAAIARQFIDADLVAEADRQRYNSTVASSHRLMNSRVVELALCVLAYALAFVLIWAEVHP